MPRPPAPSLIGRISYAPYQYGRSLRPTSQHDCIGLRSYLLPGNTSLGTTHMASSPTERSRRLRQRRWVSNSCFRVSRTRSLRWIRTSGSRSIVIMRWLWDWRAFPRSHVRTFCRRGVLIRYVLSSFPSQQPRGFLANTIC